MLRVLSLRAAIILFPMLVLQGCVRPMMTAIYLDRKERTPVVTEDAKAVINCFFVREIRSETATGYLLDPNLSLPFVIAFTTEKTLTTGEAVETVIVDGKILMENRELKTIDEEEAFRKSQENNG